MSTNGQAGTPICGSARLSDPLLGRAGPRGVGDGHSIRSLGQGSMAVGWSLVVHFLCFVFLLAFWLLFILVGDSKEPVWFKTALGLKENFSSHEQYFVCITFQLQYKFNFPSVTVFGG